MANKKKIIYIANARIPTEKAHGFQIMKTCEKFSEFGVETELWIPERINYIKGDPFNFYSIKRNFVLQNIYCFDFVRFSNRIGSLAFYLQSLAFASKILVKKIPSDSLVYSRDLILVLFLSFRGVDVVYNAHNWTKRGGFLIKYFLNKKTKIVCNSKGTRSIFVENGFTNSIAVPNGVDLEKFDSIKENKEEIRARLCLPLDKKIALYLGHLYEWKGVGVVVEGAKKSRDKNLLFIIIGGTEKDLKKYNKLVSLEDINNISFLGYKKQKDTPYYLKSSDVLLLPNIAISEESEKFTSPIKMFEYMASGVPIVASRISSICEVLNDNNAILVDPGSSEDLLFGIKKILNNNILAEKISKEALSDVKKYTWSEYSKKILRFLNIL